MSFNFKVSETRDASLVWNLICLPEIFDFIIDDFQSKKSANDLKKIISEMVLNPANHALLVEDGEIPVGVFLCNEVAEGTLEVHTCLTKKCRGHDAFLAGKAAMKFVFSLPGVEKLLSICPAHIPQSFLFAKLCGWNESAITPAIKILKNGVEYPVRLVEALRKDFTPCQH